MGTRGISELGTYTPTFVLTDELRAQVHANPNARFGGLDEDALTMSWAALDRFAAVPGGRDIVLAVPADGLEPRALVAHLEASGVLAASHSVVPMHQQADLCEVLQSAAALGEGTVAILVDRDRSQSPLSTPIGDSAVAMILGDPHIAEFTSQASLFGLSFDRWTESDERMDRDVRFIEERLAAQEGLGVVTQLKGAITGKVESFLGVVCTASAALNPSRLARLWGVPKVWIATPTATDPGATRSGTLLEALLELARGGPGSQIIVLQLGWGATGMLLTAGPGILEIEGRLSTVNSMGPAYDYRTWLVAHQPPYTANPWTSASEMSREAGDLLKLVGSKCRICAAVLFPAAGVCEHCGGLNLAFHQMKRRGTVLTHSIDELYAAPASPIQMVVVSLDGGGQFYGQAAQNVHSWFEIGESCRLVLRRIHTGAGLPHYFWKVEKDDTSDGK